MNQIIKITLFVLLISVSFSESCLTERCCVSEHNSCTTHRSCCAGFCHKIHMRDDYGTCQDNRIG